MKRLLFFFTMMVLIVSIMACSTLLTKPTGPQASWSGLKELKFDDLWYLAMNDSLKRKDLSTDLIIDEYAYSRNDTAREYESRKLTKFNVDEYKKELLEKIKSRSFDYTGKKYRLFIQWVVRDYSPRENGFLMFHRLDNYTQYRVNNPNLGSRNFALFSYDSAGKGSFEARLHFHPYFILPLDKQKATEALKTNFNIRQNMSLPVMIEYTIDHCGVNTGNRNENGSVYCIINIEKASVFANSNINDYEKPINYLQPVDISVAY